MAAKKKEIGGPNGFERLLRHYVKLTPTRFIGQWVTRELYNELLLEIFSSWVTSLNGEKDHPNFQCAHCGQVNYNFLTIGLKGAQMVPFT
jgi:hypothetical protein